MRRLKYSRWSKRIERNILSVYHQATDHDMDEGLFWYQRAHDEIQLVANRHGITIKQACGVVAAISPGLSWGLNILQADKFIYAWVGGKRGKDLPMVGAYGMNAIRKALRMLEGEEPLKVFSEKTGPKTYNFYLNLIDPQSEEVTIDRHAKGAAYLVTGEKNAIVGRKEYGYLAGHYQTLAERLGLIPNKLQAICWVTWKRIKDLKGEVPF